jgi:hypothetical protein
LNSGFKSWGGSKEGQRRVKGESKDGNRKIEGQRRVTKRLQEGQRWVTGVLTEGQRNVSAKECQYKGRSVSAHEVHMRLKC